MSRRTANSKYYIRYKIKGINRCSFLLYWFWHKSHYENVPFEIPESWCWCKLSDVCNFESGYAFSSDDYKDKGTPLVRISNIQDGLVSLDNCVYIEGDIDKRFIISNGDLLIAMSGATTGKMGVYQYDCPALLNQRVGNIKVNTSLLLQKYRDYFMQSQGDLILKLSYGGAQPNVSAKIISDLFIPIPSLNEQEKIVAEIEKWFGFIDEIENGKIELESHIKKTKSKILDLAISGKLVPQDPNDEPAIELLKRINPDFEPCDNSHYENLPENWCLAKVKDVFVINPRNKAEDNTIAGFIPMTLIDDGYSNTFSYEKRKWGAIKTGFTHFADGDVAVAKISPCLENRKSIVLRDLPNGIGAGTTELHVFRSSVVSPEYALYFFKSEYFISRCVGTFNGVVGQQRVGKNIIEEIQIPIPPINEQTKIVSTIEKIFTQLNTITAEL